MRIEAVAVAVPAKDEAETVEASLRSVVAAADVARARHPGLRVVIVLVADGCSDGTEVIARRIPGVEVVVTLGSRVGAARRTGIATALALLGVEDDRRAGRRLRGTWIANTDADSSVPVNWLVSQLAHADAGADVVVGTVRPDPADLTVEQNTRWLETHPRGRPNGHVHGANLGVRASSYDAVGGFEPIDEHEDNQLVSRLRDAGTAIVASDDAEVLTSARLVGRTPGGYAGYLAATL